MTDNTSRGAEQVAGYVLAGGASTRFGRDKALAELGGQPMLLLMTALLESAAAPVTVVAPPERYPSFRLRMVADRWPGAGPLGGITTALLHTRDTMPGCVWNLIIGCDLPYLSREWLGYLAQRAQRSSADVVLPVSADGFLEPLCAVYRTAAGPALSAALGRSVRKITSALEGLKTETLDESHWKRFDSAGRLFRNMNTAEEYERIRAEWKDGAP